MKKTERSVLRGIYSITILMFMLLSVSEKSFDYRALIFGASACVLVAYGHFIITHFFPSGDKLLLIVVDFLVQFGLIMIYRLNPELAWKQLIWFALGTILYVFLVMLLPSISSFGKLKYSYIVIAIALVASTLFFGDKKHGAINWITIGRLGFQPSEIAKLFLILYLAAAFKKVNSFKKLIIAAIPVVICIFFLIVEKDLGAAFIFFGIFTTMLFIASSSPLYPLASIGAFAIGAVASYFTFSHVRSRVAIWLDPWAYSSGQGYQICQSLFAIAAGGLFGTGLGQGHPEIIPVVYSDLIFSAICEEFGILGAVAVVILYFLLVYRGLRTAIHTRNPYSRLVAVGISSMFAFQVFVIIGGVIKLIPLTGITMPFVSYGGTSMILNFAALGVLQKISETVAANRRYEQ